MNYRKINEIKVNKEVDKENNKWLDDYQKWYYQYKDMIEYKLRFWEEIHLLLFENFISYKYDYAKEMNILVRKYEEEKDENEKKEIIRKLFKLWYEELRKTLDYIWKMFKERKVMVELYDIIDKEKEKDWDIKSIWWLDPCKIEDEEKLDKKIRDWQSWVIETYRDLEKKYGKLSAEILFDVISIKRSSCYEWEIRIE